MSRLCVISTDCHAGLPPGEYRDYLDPGYREQYDSDVRVQLEAARETRKLMLVEDINEEWRQGIEVELTGAWDHARGEPTQDLDLLDGDPVDP